MLIFKILGAVCMIVSALRISSLFIKRQRSIYAQIEGFILLIGYINDHISSYMMPIDMILKSCPADVLAKCRVNIDKSYSSLEELLNDCTLQIDTEVASSLKAFSADFGAKYRDEQIRSCATCIEALSKYKEEYRDKKEREKKIALAMSLSISVSIILLLI